MEELSALSVIVYLFIKSLLKLGVVMDTCNPSDLQGGLSSEANPGEKVRKTLSQEQARCGGACLWFHLLRKQR
jgi:hypothetical protein